MKMPASNRPLCAKPNAEPTRIGAALAVKNAGLAARKYKTIFVRISDSYLYQSST
jgi:hypothetical protein